MRTLLLSLIGTVALAGSSTALADWTPAGGDKFQQQVAETITAYRNRPRLAKFFAEAHAFAVFPRILRFGLAFGTAFGKGLVFEDGELVGRAGQRQLSLGPQIGAQTHSQIIFFKDAETLQLFQTGRREFLGRASATGGVWGASTEPANLPPVAIFSDAGAGLMLELSAAGIRYTYQPLE